MSREIETQVIPEATMTDELAKAIQEAVSTADVKSLLIAAAEKQMATNNQLAADQAAAEKVAADKIAADQAAVVAAQSFKRTENIGGRDFEFDGASEAEVDRLILNAYKIAYSVREATPAVAEPVPDAAAIAAAAEAEVAAKVDLERKFKLGEISASEYIQQSGALKSYLESEGISLDSLKEITTANKGEQFTKSWAEAGEEFRKSPAGADWPGGDKNQELIGLQIAALGLVDSTDKVAALAQAFATMKRTGLYFPNGDTPATAAATTSASSGDAAATLAAAAVAADTARVAEALRAAAAAKVRSTSSSMFGQSSGLSGAPITSPAVVAAKSVVPDNATPAEILQAWKEAQVAGGIDPNAAFVDAYRTSRR